MGRLQKASLKVEGVEREAAGRGGNMGKYSAIEKVQSKEPLRKGAGSGSRGYLPQQKAI